MPHVYTRYQGERIVLTTRAGLMETPTPEAYRSDAYDLIAQAYEAARKSGMGYEEARSLWSFPFYVWFNDLEDTDGR